MRKIIYLRSDGGLSIVHPVRNTVGEVPDITDAEIEQRAWNKLPLDAINPQWIDGSAIPFDRTFRNAWKTGTAIIEYDMPKCREIWRNKLREVRKPKMETFDVAYMRADEVGDIAEKRRIAAEKQKLRDIIADPAIEAAQTPEELKAVWPAALGPKIMTAFK